MDKYEVFALIALACSMISMVFCGFGLYFMIGNVDFITRQVSMIRRMFWRRRKHG